MYSTYVKYSDNTRYYSKWPPSWNRRSYAKSEKNSFIVGSMANDWHSFGVSRSHGLRDPVADVTHVLNIVTICVKIQNGRHRGTKSRTRNPKKTRSSSARCLMIGFRLTFLRLTVSEIQWLTTFSREIGFAAAILNQDGRRYRFSKKCQDCPTMHLCTKFEVSRVNRHRVIKVWKSGRTPTTPTTPTTTTTTHDGRSSP